MEEKIKILIVEDEMVIAANISLELTQLGYEVVGLVPRGEQALLHLKENTPDILLMDINLKGTLDGIETVRKMQELYDIPVIYLTANSDEANFNRAKQTHPAAFISKPFKKLDLQRAIELTVSALQSKMNDVPKVLKQEPNSFVLSDSIFVRHNNTMVKVAINSILYIEAERNYCRIYSKTKEHLLVITLKDIAEKLPSKYFIRVHRSFIVNLSQINELGTGYLIIMKKMIPVSKSFKEELLKRLQTI